MRAQDVAIAALGTGDRDAMAAPRNQAMGKKITVLSFAFQDASPVKARAIEKRTESTNGDVPEIMCTRAVPITIKIVPRIASAIADVLVDNAPALKSAEPMGS